MAIATMPSTGAMAGRRSSMTPTITTASSASCAGLRTGADALVGYCLMPNHFHLVLWPRGDDDLSIWMQWLLTAQVHGFQSGIGVAATSGKVALSKRFPFEEDDHLLTVLRYVERNALRADLVSQSRGVALVKPAATGCGRRCCPGLILGLCRDHPVGWNKCRRQLHRRWGELAVLRRSVERGTPYGSPVWVERTAQQLSLESSLFTKRVGHARRAS